MNLIKKSLLVGFSAYITYLVIDNIITKYFNDIDDKYLPTADNLTKINDKLQEVGILDCDHKKEKSTNIVIKPETSIIKEIKESEDISTYVEEIKQETNDIKDITEIKEDITDKIIEPINVVYVKEEINEEIKEQIKEEINKIKEEIKETKEETKEEITS